MNEFLLQQEKELCQKYGVNSISEVLEKQKEIMEVQNARE
jgi:hypothetical protein